MEEIYSLCIYQAILAKNDFGYRLTRNLRVSSNINNAIPKPNAGQTNFTGTGVVLNTELNHGTRVMSKPTQLEKVIPMRMVKLRAFPKNGLC
jgi:hypothetical protein